MIRITPPKLFERWSAIIVACLVVAVIVSCADLWFTAQHPGPKQTAPTREKVDSNLQAANSLYNEGRADCPTGAEIEDDNPPPASLEPHQALVLLLQEHRAWGFCSDSATGRP